MTDAENEELWYVQLDSGQVSTMTLDQLDEAFESGLVHANTLVVLAGESEWQPLSVVAGLEGEDPEQQAQAAGIPPETTAALASQPATETPVWAPSSPAAAQATPAQPVAAQPVPAQPVTAQPVPAQPVPAQPVPAQPQPGAYGAAPQTAQAYANQPQYHQALGHQQQPVAEQPHPGQTWQQPQQQYTQQPTYSQQPTYQQRAPAAAAQPFAPAHPAQPAGNGYPGAQQAVFQAMPVHANPAARAPVQQPLAARQIQAFPQAAAAPNAQTFAAPTPSLDGFGDYDLGGAEFKTKRGPGLIIGALAAVAVLGGIGFAVSQSSSEEVLVASPPKDPFIVPKPSALAAGTAGNSDSKTEPKPSAAKDDDRFSDAAKAALLAADKKREEDRSKKKRVYSAKPRKGSGSSFAKGGSAYDPLNGSL